MNTNKPMVFEITRKVNEPDSQKLLNILNPLKAYIDHTRDRVSFTIPESRCQEIIAELQGYGLKLIDKDALINEKF